MAARAGTRSTSGSPLADYGRTTITEKKAGRKVPRIIQLTVALISKVVVLISILSMPTASEKRLKASNRTLAK